MGLDQFAFAIDNNGEKEELAYWRKHPNLLLSRLLLIINFHLLLDSFSVVIAMTIIKKKIWSL
ncbi:MAG: hypothetical protein EBT86_12380 [Actinobacteria bacterium]|nr:hypothetical protein [Actinomycetota bacterium]